MSLSISSTSNNITIDATTNTITFSAPGPAGTPGATGATGETGSAFASGSPLVVQTEPMSPGERLAKQAVWWIDAAASGSSAAGATNLGWGGSALNAAQAVSANQPKWLEYTGTPYVWLPGVASNFLSVPDEAALDITGDIDIRVKVAPDDWTPAGNTTLASKWGAAGQRTWQVYVGTTGFLNFVTSEDGTASAIITNSSVALGITDGTVKWVRVTRAQAAGEVKFYTSDDGSTWTQLGTTRTGLSTNAMFTGTSITEIGSVGTGTSQVGTFKFYRAIVKNGIDGTTVLDIDTSVIGTGSATSFNALTGQTVSVNRSTTGRKAVAVVAPVWLFGTDDYLETADNDLLDFGATDSFTVVAGVRVWATQAGREILSKASGSGVGHTGYLIQSDASTMRAVSIDDGTARTAGVTPTVTAGAVSAVTGVRSVSGDTVTPYLNGVAGTPVTDTTTTTLANALPLRVGRTGGTGSTYSDMEGFAFLVFRRALSATEITVLSDWLKGRGY
jgi:hypothetical protein